MICALAVATIEGACTGQPEEAIEAARVSGRLGSIVVGALAVATIEGARTSTGSCGFTGKTLRDSEASVSTLALTLHVRFCKEAMIVCKCLQRALILVSMTCRL